MSNVTTAKSSNEYRFSEWYKRNLFKIGIAFFVLYGFIHAFDMWPKNPSSLPFLFGQIICAGLILIWMISVRWRIVKTYARRAMIVMGFFLLMWFLLRFARYRAFFAEPDIRRYIWYCYYIPQIIVPLIAFLAALHMGKTDRERISGKWNILFVFAAIIIIAVLSNDYHQLAFNFPEGEVWSSDHFNRGPIYVIAISWMFALILATIMSLYFMNSVENNRREVWRPLMLLAGAICYGVWYVNGPFILPHRPVEITEGLCFFFIMIMENCINTGLFPSNMRYEKCFTASTISLQILDNDANVVYKSRNAIEIDKKYLDMAKKESIFINPDIKLCSNEVSGGRIYWTENFAIVNELKEQLEETAHKLEGYNELLKEMNEIKRQREKIRVKSHLYDTIAEKVKPQLQNMEELLNGTAVSDKDLKSKLAEICVLNAYIKRHSNLTILMENKKYLPLDELYFSIRESVDYLNTCDIYASLHSEHEGEFLSETVVVAYEMFESVIEAVMSDAEIMMISMRGNAERLLLRIAVEGVSLNPEDLDLAMINHLKGSCFFEKEGDTCYISMKFSGGGSS
ncbi:MAG: histidine kinase N-terminal 7TM domain-containing protein [Anaerovoracaceae bacterium]